MKLFKLLFFTFIPFLAIANTGTAKKHEKTKTIKKSFSVNENATVFLKNKYGNLNVTTWDRNTVDITVKITVKGNDLNDVEDKLSTINVLFEATKSLVEARTTIKSKKSGWSFWGNSSNVNYEINYFVRMPKTNNADFNNRYGNIELDVLDGKANINCDYGKIEIEKLNNTTNIIDLDYCSSSEISFIKSGNISIDYSKLKIKDSEKINVNADYSNLRCYKTSDIDFNCDYGSIIIDEANNINGNSDYTGVKIGTLKKNLKIDTDYGGVKIRNLEIGFENVTINSSYAGVKINTSSANAFNFKVDLGYAGFKYPNDMVDMYKSIKKTTKKYYEGKFGNSSSKSTVTIKSRYGGVSLKLTD